MPLKAGEVLAKDQRSNTNVIAVTGGLPSESANLVIRAVSGLVAFGPCF